MAKTIKEEVAATLSKSGKNVKDAVIANLAQVEIDKRIDLVTKGVKKLDELQKAQNKMKPDNVTYNDDGSEASATWSKSKLDERNKGSERISKLSKAIDNALDKNEYDQLSKLVN